MNFVYSVASIEERVHVVGCGNLTAAACVGLIHRLAADPAYREHFSILIDVREATYEPLRPADFLEVASALAAQRADFAGPIALLARGTLLLAAETLATLARLQGHINMRVFVDLAAAEFYGGVEAAPKSHAQGALLPATVAGPG